MQKKHLVSLICASALVAPSALQAQIAPAQPIDTSRPLPGPDRGPLKPKVPLHPCQVDPAVSSVYLYKGKSRGSVQVSVQLKNVGSEAWSSAPRQAHLNIVVTNGNTGSVWSRSFPLSTHVPAGGNMGRFTTPFIPDAFDDFERGGTVRAEIYYDPDVAIDAQRCNDDINATNNRRLITNEQVFPFISSTARSATF